FSEEGTEVEARQPWQVGVVAGVRLDFEPSVGHGLQLGCAHVAVNAVVEAGQGEEDRRNRHVREHRQSIQVLTEQAVVKRKDDAAAGWIGRAGHHGVDAGQGGGLIAAGEQAGEEAAQQGLVDYFVGVQDRADDRAYPGHLPGRGLIVRAIGRGHRRPKQERGGHDYPHEPSGEAHGGCGYIASAASRSVIRSASASMPTDNLSRRSLGAIASPIWLACVIVSGCAISDSTPPKPEASRNRRVPSATRRAVSRSPRTSKETMPPLPRICRRATAWP